MSTKRKYEVIDTVRMAGECLLIFRYTDTGDPDDIDWLVLPPDGLWLEGRVYVTGVGQVLRNVHRKKDCAGDSCVIHNLTDHAMRAYPTLWRGDAGFMERLCTHGVGHPDPDDLYAHDVHGCDGCCSWVGQERNAAAAAVEKCECVPQIDTETTVAKYAPPSLGVPETRGWRWPWKRS